MRIDLTGESLAAAQEIQRLRVEAFKEGIRLRTEMEQRVEALVAEYNQLMDDQWGRIWSAEGITFPRAEPLALTVSPDGQSAYLEPMQSTPPKEALH